MSIHTAESHIIALSYEAWGISRAEFSRHYEAEEDEVCSSRLRVVALEHTGIFTSEILDRGYSSALRKLLDGEAVACAQTGTIFPPGPKPQAVIIDCLAYTPLRDTKAIGGDKLKVYWWFPGQLAALFPMFGPEQFGGKGNVQERAEHEARRTGRPMMEIADEIISKIDGSIIHPPGLPPMYDYELHPQEYPIPDNISTTAFWLGHRRDTLVTPESYEPEAVIALKSWLRELSKPAYVVGPLLPPHGARAVAPEMEQSLEARDIATFLDGTLGTSGERSLLYISLGSVFWPVKASETIWPFLDVVMQLEIPFVLGHASPFAIVPETVTAKVRAYGKGIMAKWVPQQLVLNHPATSWFVTHGGQNGVLESITAGVPQCIASLPLRGGLVNPFFTGLSGPSMQTSP
ncbi:hypothetical protein C8Q77DRAFT_1073203 [Trametes polyzona]|nr:hypothetical protein C8Q77DRAFT_1073203 [Trametes polyzona]